MNIFYLSEDPIESATMQCDKHIVKMPLESAQMLSGAHRVLDGMKVERRKVLSSGKISIRYNRVMEDDDKEAVLYKLCHENHPCTLWTMENSANYNWHYKHWIALCEEYTRRYGRIHLSHFKLKDILKNLPEKIKKSNEMTPVALAMGANPECIDHKDPVGSYRSFYHTKKERFNMTWKNCNPPDWFIEKDLC
jgi:hypothetical protein